VLELTGKSDGEGTVRIGVDLLIPFASRRDELRVKLAFEAASQDGLTTLVESTADGFRTESAVAGVLDLTYTTLQKAPGFDEQTTRTALPAARRAALRTCPAGTRAAAAMASGTESDLAALRRLDYCAEARQILSDAESRATLPLPRRQLALAVSVGRSAFSYLSAAMDPGMLTPLTTRKPRLHASLQLAQYAAQARFTLELTSSIESAYTASNRRARWCVPVGSVGLEPAESCSEMRLGAPTRAQALSAAGYVGFVGDDNHWRVAMGPTARLDSGGDRTAYEVGLALPLSLVRSSAGFTGVVRVTPAVLFLRDADGARDTKALLTLTLLGDRTLLGATPR
jgi:hypothetical protein